MPRPRLYILVHIFRRRPASWLALFGQWVALFGLPMPAISAKDISQPFPCQHRQCGCMRAADCWNQCCCFSAQERVAWARRHGAEIPESLVEKARQSEKPGDCCIVKNVKTTTPGGKIAQRLLGFMARQCQGQQALWGDGEPAPLPNPIFQWCFDAQPVDWCLPPAWCAPFVVQIPPVPPPRGCMSLLS
jgi:hypothetical protein